MYSEKKSGGRNCYPLETFAAGHKGGRRFGILFGYFRELGIFAIDMIYRGPGIFDISPALIKLLSCRFLIRIGYFVSSLGDLCAYARTKRNKTYILKPDTGCQGKGIYLTRNVHDLKPHTRMICQAYISKVKYRCLIFGVTYIVTGRGYKCIFAMKSVHSKVRPTFVHLKVLSVRPTWMERWYRSPFQVGPQLEPMRARLSQLPPPISCRELVVAVHLVWGGLREGSRHRHLREEKQGVECHCHAFV